MIPHQPHPWAVYKGGDRYVSISLAIFVISGKINKGFSYTLVGCIHQLSPLFTKNLEIYINQILNTE